MKIDFEAGKVVEEFDGLYMIQDQRDRKSLRSDEVFNGIAYHS